MTVAIIGGGVAGAATAWALSKRPLPAGGRRKILILEREEAPGRHASGKNAGMIRQAGVEPAFQSLVAAGARALRAFLTHRNLTYRSVGSLLVGGEADASGLRLRGAAAARMGIATKMVGAGDLARRVPWLAGLPAAEGLWCPADGVVDPHEVLSALLEDAASRGVEVWTRCEVRAGILEGGRLRALETSRGILNVDIAVNAAGAWASEAGARVGGAALEMRPFRRHLMYTGPLPEADPSWPFVWHASHHYYFRPESGGLLLSPGDETSHPAREPETDPAALHQLATSLQASGLAKSDFPIARTWACLRTFAPDRRPVIGRDPGVENLYWVAGLGGHGVTAGLAVGERAADYLTGKRRKKLEVGTPHREPVGAPA